MSSRVFRWRLPQKKGSSDLSPDQEPRRFRSTLRLVASMTLIWALLLPTFALLFVTGARYLRIRQADYDFGRVLHAASELCLVQYDREQYRDMGLWGGPTKAPDLSAAGALMREPQTVHLEARPLSLLNQPDELRFQIRRWMALRTPFRLASALISAFQSGEARGLLPKEGFSDTLSALQAKDPQELLRELLEQRDPADEGPESQELITDRSEGLPLSPEELHDADWPFEQFGVGVDLDDAEEGWVNDGGGWSGPDGDTNRRERVSESPVISSEESGHERGEEGGRQELPMTWKAAKRILRRFQKELDVLFAELHPSFQSTPMEALTVSDLSPNALLQGWNALDQMWDGLMHPARDRVDVAEYILAYTQSAQEKEEKGTALVPLTHPDGRIWSQLKHPIRTENILFEGGEKRCQQVIKGLRFLLNFASSMTNPRAIQAQRWKARWVSMAVWILSLGAVHLPPEPIIYLFLAIEAYRTAGADLKNLLEGRRIPFYPRESLTPSMGLFLDYRDYLRIFALWVGPEQLCVRLGHTLSARWPDGQTASWRIVVRQGGLNRSFDCAYRSLEGEMDAESLPE